MMQRFWHKINPYWHIITGLAGFTVLAILWFGKVDAYGERIDTLETTQSKQQAIITRTDYNVQIIARKIGVRPLEKGDDE